MVKLFICGDILNYEKHDTSLCSVDLCEIIKSADYSVCNFEAPVAGHGSPQPKSGPHHCQHAKTIELLKKQGFNLLLLANNHIMDFGEVGLKATIDQAKSIGLETLGAGTSSKDAYKPLILSIKELKIGLINACEAQFGVIDHFNRPSSAGYAWINHPLIDKSILSLKNYCDFIIVFCHAGLENYSIPQKEWRERYRLFCDFGADVVVGSHPHVPQGFERHGKSIIFYSLGNFYFDSKNFKDKEDSSYALLLELRKRKPPIFKPVFHYKNDGFVKLAPKDKRIDLDALNSQIRDGYEFSHDQMSLKAYEGIKRNLLISLLPIPFDGKVRTSLHYIASRLLRRKKETNKTLLQLHLLRNESYYYATKHALEVQARRR